MGKGPTGTGYLASKVPPNFIEVNMTLMNHDINDDTDMILGH